MLRDGTLTPGQVRSIAGRPSPPRPGEKGTPRLLPIQESPHLYPPSYSKPFEVKTFSNDLGNTLTAVISQPVPEGMVAFIDYFWQDAADFTLGITENFVEFRLLADAVPIPPYERFTGIISPRTAPRRRRIVLQIAPQQVITVFARVLPTAEGGLDTATADVTTCVAGWFIPITRLAKS